MKNFERFKWTLIDKNSDKINQLTQKYHLAEPLIQIILNRGISLKDFDTFLSPSLDKLQYEFSVEQMQIASKRLIRAIKDKEKITVFGDYDGDGVTGTVLLLDALKYLGGVVDYYVPHRYLEGYGLNNKAIRQLKERGTSLIVTVDCGISDFEEIAEANALGVEVIVTDHHTPPQNLPKAVAVINPKLEQNNISYHLAGVGVAYCFMLFLFKNYFSKDLLKSKKYLDLVAIGTITDVVPLIGDNRIFVKEGLKKLNKDTSLGLFYLLEKMEFAKDIDTYAIGFGIGPRLNAAGRLDSADIGIELLITKNRAKAMELAENLNELNEKRKLEGEKIFLDAESLVAKDPESLKSKVIILSSDGWEPGVIGIVASQLAKLFERPVVLISTKGGLARGSIRSFANINIFSALEQSKDLLTSFGGHKEAAGFEINPSRINDFKDKYRFIINKQLADKDLISEVCIDYELSPEHINIKLADSLKLLSPFGEGNREPVFLTKNLNAIDYRKVGKDGKHIKVLFIHGVRRFNAIGFKMGDYEELLNNCNTFDVVYNLEINEYNGEREIQLKLIDIKPSVS